MFRVAFSWSVSAQLDIDAKNLGLEVSSCWSMVITMAKNRLRSNNDHWKIFRENIVQENGDFGLNGSWTSIFVLLNI